VGKHILIGRQPAPSEIVGLTASVKNNGLATDPQPQIYLPFPQLPWNNMNLLVGGVTDPRSLLPAIRAQIAAMDPDQPVTGIQTVEELMDSSRVQPRAMLLLFGAFSVTALALVVVGIYGVLAYSVAQRRGELGIRLALGAEKSDILRMVVKQGLTLTMAGIGIGLALALILSFVLNRFVSDQLYKVGTHDLLTFLLAPLAFLAIALVASYLPALRATRVDPTEALRSSN
jgi:ABC-type antimicrobial peptide transport system permease subunit